MFSLQMGSLCLLVFSFIFLFCIPTGEAITCYECNSNNDTRCANEEPPPEFKKDCSQHVKQKEQPYTLCRKITQSIEFEVNGMKPNTRVIRACGWDRTSYVDKCYQRSGFGGRQEVCSCSEDNCNSAFNVRAPVSAIAVVTALHVAATRLLF